MSADRFFEELRSYWAPPPPGLHDSRLGHWKELMELENRLRRDESLAGYDRELYPELVTLLGFSQTDRMSAAAEADHPRAVLHLCVQQLQIMEQVFLALQLDRHHAHAMNRGWMNLFMRWSAHPVMGLLWPSLKARHSKHFVEFADEQLNFSWFEIRPQPYSDPAPQLAPLFAVMTHRRTEALQPGVEGPLRRLFEELGQEWPQKDAALDPLYFGPFLASTEVWTVGHPASSDEIWGLALVAPQPGRPDFQRLMLWIRPGYRGVGLGTRLLKNVLMMSPTDAAQEAYDEASTQRKHHMLVLLPPLRRDRPGYREEMAGWLQFFGREGFVRAIFDDAKRLLRLDDGAKQFEPDAFCLATSQAILNFRKAEPKVTHFSIAVPGQPDNAAAAPPMM